MQFDKTYDFFSMSGDEIINLLPAEFDRFKNITLESMMFNKILPLFLLLYCQTRRHRILTLNILFCAVAFNK